MKKARLLYYSTLLAAGCTFTACEKDTEGLNKTDLLINKDWKMTAGTVTPGIPNGSTTIRDVYDNYAPCRQDNLWRFETPSVFKELSGPTRCSGEPALKTGNWRFSEDQKRLFLIKQGSSTTDDYEVLDLTSNTLRVKTSESLNGTMHTFTYTYSKQ